MKPKTPDSLYEPNLNFQLKPEQRENSRKKILEIGFYHKTFYDLYGTKPQASDYYIGIDILTGRMKGVKNEAKKQHPNSEFLAMNGRRLGFKDDSIDEIRMSRVLSAWKSGTINKDGYYEEMRLRKNQMGNIPYAEKSARAKNQLEQESIDDKLAITSEAIRVLKRGGKIYFYDDINDVAHPEAFYKSIEALKDNPQLSFDEQESQAETNRIRQNPNIPYAKHPTFIVEVFKKIIDEK